jgi:hypothetical protein
MIVQSFVKVVEAFNRYYFAWCAILQAEFMLGVK